MLKNIFFTLVFFIVDHLVLGLAASLISVIAHEVLLQNLAGSNAGPGYEISVSHHLAIIGNLLLIFIAGVVYIITIIIVFFPELRKLMGK